MASLLGFLGFLTVMLWAALASAMIYPCALLPRGKRERLAIWPARMFGWLCVYVTCLARVSVVGLENLPRKPGYLVVSNHRSWVDVGLLILHTRSLGISKKEIAYIPFFGLAGYIAGVIFFDRKSKISRGRVIEDALNLLHAGANLHVFPEGTRTRDGRVREKVFLRLLSSCHQAGIEVVPACVWGTERAVPATGIALHLGEQVGLEIGAPLVASAYTSSADYARDTWARVLSMARSRGADEPFSPATPPSPPRSST
ncbi:MAG: 1-acyl-sn-glycerol-3-phosphate acyltransferase [Deltaproteobacteria bacterium]|nr:1-acyl-sn-glycerol-3-phosphate acyltransferase [Deltaproteobacteria bacterium]